MKLEHCCQCSAPTGRAGPLDDSIYVGTCNVSVGPLCESCRDEILEWAKQCSGESTATVPALVIEALESARAFCIAASKDRVRINGFDHSQNATVVKIDAALHAIQAHQP